MTFYRRKSLVLLTLILVGLILPWRPAFAHSDAQSAAATGDCTNQLGIGTVNWTTPGNAFSNNGVYATRGVDGTTSRWIRCLNYGFAIPAGATILGIEVNVERRSSSAANGGSRDAGMRLVKAGVIEPVANDRSTATVYPTVDTVEIHGSPTDLWGTTWSVAEINAANFGAAFAVTKPSAAGAAHTVSVDHIQIVVYYSEPPPAPTLSSPADGATVTTSTPTFDWTDVVDPDGDTVTYEVQADDTDCSFGSPELNQTGLAASTFTPGAALADGTYCWRARALDAHGIPGSYSSTRNVAINTVNAFDAVAVSAAMNTAITTKIAGSTFSLDVLALKAGAIHTGYRGSVTVEIVDAATGGGVCASMTQLQNLGSFTFVAGDSGRKTVNTFSYANAAANARIRVIDSSVGITNCSFDNFAIRPNTLANLSVTDTDWENPGTVRTLNSTAFGAIVHKAGRNFTVRADAHNTSSAITNAYTGSPTATLTACGPGAGFEACTAAFGTMSIASGFAAGQLNSNATYSEAGSFNLQLQDTTFAAVDALDTAADCTATGRYVCSASTAVGRFVPDHFIVTLGTLTNRRQLSCAPASTFTYEGEQLRVTFMLTARNGLGAPTTTANYTTASGIARLDGTVFANFGFGAVDLADATPPLGATALNSRVPSGTSSGTWLAGIGSFTVDLAVSRAASPDGPFESFQLGAIPADPDGVTLQAAALNLDTDVPANGNDRVLLGSSKIRFGRLTIGNASGSSNLPLPVRLEAQYWNDKALVTNTIDGCTPILASVASSNINMTNYTAPLTDSPLCLTALSGGGTLTAGRLTLQLAAPNTNGSVDLTVNLGASASGNNTCLSVGAAPTAETAADRAYLQSGAGYTQNPSARATFGIFKGSEEVIFIRENF